MKIERFEFVEVIVPARSNTVNSPEIDQPLHKLSHEGHSAWSVQFDEISKWMIIAHTDDGAVGFGEGLRGVTETAQRRVAESLLGISLNKLPWSRFPVPEGRVYDGFESVLLDLRGKAAGMSLHQLLGGAHRDRVLVSAWSGHRTPEDAADRARAALDDGIHHIKFKCSLEDDVVAWAQAIRDVCGESMGIILDPNDRFEELRHAVAIAQRLERIGNVVCLEDPLPRWDLESYAELRQRTSIPIAVHVALGYAEHGQKEQDVLLALRLRAADVFNLSGGIAGVQRMAAILDVARRPWWHGSEVDLGLLEAAYVHMAAASPGCQLPSDIFGRRIREHDLLVEPLDISGEHVRVPQGPGLGVQLDEEALSRYEISRFDVSR